LSSFGLSTILPTETRPRNRESVIAQRLTRSIPTGAADIFGDDSFRRGAERNLGKT
jgi:hypothetical protein